MFIWVNHACLDILESSHRYFFLHHQFSPQTLRIPRTRVFSPPPMPQTATMVPGQIFLMFFLINLSVWYHQSAAAVPFGVLGGPTFTLSSKHLAQAFRQST